MVAASRKPVGNARRRNCITVARLRSQIAAIKRFEHLRVLCFGHQTCAGPTAASSTQMRLIEDVFLAGRIPRLSSAQSVLAVANVIVVFLPLALSIEAPIVKRAPQVTVVGRTTVQLMLRAVDFDYSTITAYYVVVARKDTNVAKPLRLLNSTEAAATGLGYYVTARFTANEITGRPYFTVGAGEVVGGFKNVPLRTGTLYKFGWVAETRLFGESRFGYRITPYSIAPTAPGFFQKLSVAGETVVTWNKTDHHGGWTQVDFGSIAYVQPDCDLDNGEQGQLLQPSRLRHLTRPKLRAHTYYFVSISPVTSGEGGSKSFIFQTAEEVPSGRPGNLVHSMSPDAFDALTWSEVPCDQLNGANVTYFVELSSNDTWEADTRGSSVRGTREIYTDLIPFTMYQARVFAQNNAGRSPTFASVKFTTPPASPPEPTDLRIFWLTTSSILVSWNAPYPPHGVLDHYELKFWSRADPETVSHMTFAAEECLRKRALVPRHCVTVEDLHANTGYRFSVMAVNKGGLFSPYSVQPDIDERRSTGRLKNLYSSERGQLSLKIHWSTSDIRNERPAGYMVNTSLVHTFNRKLAMSQKPMSYVLNGSKVQEFLLTSLYPASTYLVCVQAITRIVKSYPSCSNFSTRASAPIIEKAPTVEALNETTVNVSLSPVDSDGGPVKAYYLLVVRKVHEVVAPIKLANFSGSAVSGLAYYVAARFTPDELSGRSHFIVGEGGVNGDFENPSLVPGTQYSFGWVAETNFSGETLYGYRLTPSILVGKGVLKSESIVSSTQSYWPIVAAVAAGIFVLLLAIATTMCICQRKRESAYRSSGSRDRNIEERFMALSMSAANSEAMRACESQVAGNEYVERTSCVTATSVPSKPVSIRRLQEHVAQGLTDGSLAHEYATATTGMSHSSSATEKAEKSKKSVADVFPYDPSPVVLTDPEGPRVRDYINASYVPDFKNPRKYIAAKDPTLKTILDFWQMIWQEDVRKVVMLSDGGKEEMTPTEKYWPEFGEKYGEFVVTLRKTDVKTDFIVREFEVVLKNQKRCLQQFQYTAWPCGGVPAGTDSLQSFVRSVRQNRTNDEHRILVHSSEGVGRTGTFILIDSMVSQAEADGEVDFVKQLYLLRQSRANAVETLEQYISAYQVLVIMVCSRSRMLTVEEFLKLYHNLNCVHPATGKTPIHKEYEELNQLRPQCVPEDLIGAVDKRNALKGSSGTSAAADNRRPLISSAPDGVTKDRINPVYVDGFKKTTAFIVTRVPSPGTSSVDEFWELAARSASITLVTLGPLQQAFWPDKGSTSVHRDVAVEHTESTDYPDFVVRMFRVTQLKKPSRIVKQFHCHTWNCYANAPSPCGTILEVFSQVQSWQMRAEGPPLMVQCPDGCVGSGVFCTMLSICEQLKFEHELNVFQCVQRIRSSHREFIVSAEQYAFCYKMAHSFLESFSAAYSNFS